MGGGGSLQHQQQVQVVDPDRPRFHVHPAQGWMNDPNGPVFYKGRYHMFYQHLPNACEWAFGIVWGHAVSSDLVHWEHLPPALVPTPGTLDADGCFSGSCVLDSDGTPVLLYTGVRLRSNESAGELPPPEHDLGMVWIETQLAAVPEDPDDELLIRWRKIPSPFLHLPPSHLQLTGWRDPFIFVTNTAASPAHDGFSTNGYSQELRMLIGSGLKGRGGTALVYKSCSLLEGWELEGTLCEAQNTDTGVVWECPLLVPLDPVPRHRRAPSKQLPPGWLVAAHQAAAGGGVAEDSSGGFGSIDSMSQESSGASSSTSNGTAGDAVAAAEAHPKLRLGLAGALAAQAAAAGAASRQQGEPPPSVFNSGEGGSAQQGTAAVPAAAPAAAEDAAAGALVGGAAGEGKQLGGTDAGSCGSSDQGEAADGAESATEAAGQPAGFSFANHQRADSFAFDRDLSLDDLSQAEEAASAVTAWQQQAASAGGSAAASGLASPAASGLGETPAAAGPLAAGSAATAAAAAAAAAAGADLDAPSNAAALPPGRRGRRLLADAKLALESAATLQDWSAPASQAASPVQPLSGAGSPEAKPSPDRARRSGGAPPRPPRLDLSPPGARGGRGPAVLPQHGEAHQEEDRFAAAFSQIRGIRPRTRSSERPPLPRSGSRAQLPVAAAAHGGQPDLEQAASGATEADTPAPPERQWHFFTVSPDAPTNPVLYWMGHVQDTEAARFELETAKGPYRLDLGDVLYAPNVCQDDKGRWLLWGWLQERRKMGSYNYAGCLTLPRELHCTEDGRLVQAPIPELVKLRQGAPHQQHGVRVPAEACVPLRAAPAAPALDIELTLDRGTSFAAGLLFRSYDAEAEGGTALIYDWERNMLEAIFNVPPSWQPQAAAQAVPQSARHSGAGEHEAFDPAILLTPRPGGMVSRDQSMVFSPDGLGLPGFDSLTASPRTATESLAGEQSSVLSPQVGDLFQQGGISIAGTPRPPPLDLGIPGLAPPPHLAEGLAGSGASGASDLSAAVAFGRSLPRSLSAIPAGFLAAGGALGRALQPGSLPARGLTRSVSDVRLGMTRVASHSSLQGYGTSLPRLGGAATPRLVGAPSPRRSPQAPQPIGADTDADLDFLLDELAAPMREAPPPVVEPRRVGGPLPLMQANQPIHLRILVDHSCVEVYTGTGEVMSTRIYRGRAPEGCADAGISFIAFGGAALVKSCSTWEMGSAWEHPATEPLAAKAAAAAGVKAASPRQPAQCSSGVASPAAPAAPTAPAPSGPDEGPDLEAGPEPDGAQQAVTAAAAAAAAADALLDDLVACVSPHCSAPILAGAAFASS